MKMTITFIAFKDAPAALRKVIPMFAGKRDIKLEARYTAVPSSHGFDAANAVIADLDDEASVTVRRGVMGGDNGYNKPPADRAFDPVFDREQRDVPVGGALVVGQVGKLAWVYVHPQTFAERFARHEIARDALLENRLGDAAAIQSEADALTDEECAILYVHHCLKSCDTRKTIAARYSDALEACVNRGFIKRARNGACTITTSGKSLDQTFRKRGESLVFRF